MSKNTAANAKENHYTYFQDAFKKGTLSIIGARPGIGRLKWMTDNLMVAHVQNKKAFFLSLDIPSDVLRERLNMTYENTPFVLDIIPKLELHYQVQAKINDIDSFITEQKNEKGMDTLFIDFLELILSESGHELVYSLDFDKVLKQLHTLAVKHDIAIVLGKTLNRTLELRDNSRPVLDDFGIKKSRLSLLENIIGLYRDEVYQMESEKPNTLENIVCKSALNNGIPFMFHSDFIHHFSNES